MSGPPLATIVETMPDGVVCIELPTPFPVGPVNCYVLLDEPVTVVDPGMLWGDTTALIEDALRAAGRNIRDVAQVLVTHGHPDHFGAAGWLADEADAIVLCGRADAPKITGNGSMSRLGGFLDNFGIPDELRGTFAAFFDGVRTLTHPIAASRLCLLDDGATLRAGGRDWQVHVTPGHSVGHVSLFDPTQRVLLSGDHLLACISPNPVIEPDPDGVDGRRRSLVEYLASLERFVRLEPLLVLPGHGPRFCDVPTLTAATRRHHDARADEILGLVDQMGEATPYELSAALFPHIADFSVLLGVSEVLGHLDLLEADGRVARVATVPRRYSS